MGASILVITNGDSAAGAIGQTHLEVEQILPWRDVLHEGPVPGDVSTASLRDIRAEYLAACGYGELDEIAGQFEGRDRLIETCDRFDEVVLWFEHDLYDQLQLIQVLARLKDLSLNRVSLVCDGFVAQQSTTELERQFHDRQPVTPKTYAQASAAWSCFTGADPTRWAEIASAPGSKVLPQLASAFSRLIAELPDEDTGLSMTEEFILRRLDQSNLLSAKELFRQYTREEQVEFMGDWSFFRLLIDLATPPKPLVQPSENVASQPNDLAVVNCADLSFRILPTGRQVARGEINAIGLRGVDRWIGGVHLIADAVWMRRTEEKRGQTSVYSVLGPVNFEDAAGRFSNLR